MNTNRMIWKLVFCTNYLHQILMEHSHFFLLWLLFFTYASSIPSQITLRTCSIESCNNAALRASCCSKYFKCNHCKISFDNDHIPLLILFVNNRNAPIRFPFSISCLNLDETFSMFIGVVFDGIFVLFCFLLIIHCCYLLATVSFPSPER